MVHEFMSHGPKTMSINPFWMNVSKSFFGDETVLSFIIYAIEKAEKNMNAST